MKTYYANILDAKLISSILNRLAKESPYGRCVEINVNLNDCRRTVDTHEHYRACVVKMSHALGYTKEQMDYLIKIKFLTKAVIINNQTEYIIETKMNKKKFNEFMEKLQAWAKELNIELPEPFKQSIFDFEPPV